MRADGPVPSFSQGEPSGKSLEGQGDLVSRLITFTTHIVILVIPINNLLTKSQ